MTEEEYQQRLEQLKTGQDRSEIPEMFKDQPMPTKKRMEEIDKMAQEAAKK